MIYIGRNISMRRFFIIIMLICVSNNVCAQIPTGNDKDYYMSLKTFRGKVSDTISLEHLRYRIIKGDTVIPYKRSFGKDSLDLNKVKYILKDTTFLDIYKSIAYRSVDKNEPRHRFWSDDIIIYFGESVSNYYQRKMRKFIRNNLMNIKHLNIKTTHKLENSNFVIYFDGDFEYEGRLKGNYKKRMNYHTYWTGSDIDKVTLKLIPKFYSGKDAILADLLRGFVINLGYFNKSSELGCDSVFSNCYELVEDLNVIDKEILTYHYSRGFCVGMDLKSFEEQDASAREFYKYNEDSNYYVLFRKDRF